MDNTQEFINRYKVNERGCWIWHGALDRDGYATFYEKQPPARFSRKVRAARWSYAHFVGPIPEGLVMDHLCRVRRCVNPKHLEPVTPRENVLRGKLPEYMRTHKPAKGSRGNPGQTWSRGVGNGRARLTPEKVLAIRADPRSQVVIAAEYGIGQTHVSKIKSRETWKHLPDSL